MLQAQFISIAKLVAIESIAHVASILFHDQSMTQTFPSTARGGNPSLLIILRIPGTSSEGGVVKSHRLYVCVHCACHYYRINISQNYKSCLKTSNFKSYC